MNGSLVSQSMRRNLLSPWLFQEACHINGRSFMEMNQLRGSAPAFGGGGTAGGGDDSTNDEEIPANAHTVKYSRTGKPMGFIPNAGIEETKYAIQAAHEAFQGWGSAIGDTTPKQRRLTIQRWAQQIREHERDLTQILAAESGKPEKEAQGEWTFATSYLDWYAGECERVYGEVVDQSRLGVRTLVRKQPIGVVAAITPWNFPAAMVTRAVGGPIAAGCSVVLKPSEFTPFSALALAELGTRAGLPPGTLNVVTGDAAAIGKTLCESNDVRALAFTGSTRVGKMLYSQVTDTMKRVVMELGGNAPFICFEDAKIDAACDGLILAKFRNSGQTCICANRIFVQRSIVDDFIEQLIPRLETINVGNAGGEGPRMGCMITKQHADKIRRLIDDAIKKGAKVIYEHQKMPPDDDNAETWVAPILLSNVDESMDCVREEQFGPIIALQTFDEEDEVIRRANDVRAGLAAYFYTEDYRRQWRVSERLQYGMVGVNEGIISTPNAPFGGVKESGLGRDGGSHSFDHYLDYKYTLMGGGI